jgi:hypothetical protein
MKFLTSLFYLVRKIYFSVFPRKVGAKGFVPSTGTNLKAVSGLPPAPATWKSPRLKWLMLGNGPDPTNPPQYSAGVGDCVVAGSLHAIMVVSYLLGLGWNFTATEAIKAYFSMTPNGADSGLNPPGVFEEWEAGSLPAPAAAVYGAKSGPLVTVNPQDPEQIKAAIALFGWVGIGVNLQQAQENQFSNGQKWDYVKGSPTVGGHFVILTGYDKAGVGPYTVSWGKGFRSTWAFVTNLAVEAYTGILPPVVTAGGLDGVTVQGLTTYCSELPGV